MTGSSKYVGFVKGGIVVKGGKRIGGFAKI